MGCLSGCTRYLGIPATDSWIYGATGHAFIINISRDSCPSGPTAWKTQPLFHLGRNIGYTPDGVFAFKNQPDFKETRATTTAAPPPWTAQAPSPGTPSETPASES